MKVHTITIAARCMSNCPQDIQERDGLASRDDVKIYEIQKTAIITVQQRQDAHSLMIAL